MPKIFFITGAFVILLNFPTLNSQTNYYVSESGSNSNNGLTPQSSFATLQFAADLVAAGDSVFVLGGNYDGFDIRTDGTQNSPIAFIAPGNDVIIDQPNSITPDGINIENADWIVIDGFVVINQPRAGIRIVLSDFVVIRNNHCTENYRWGIFTGFTDDILIENNSCSFSEDEHGIYVSNSSDRPIIRNNNLFNNYVCGIHMNGDISQGGDGIISDAVVEGNIIFNNGAGGGSAINMDGVQNSEIYNNLIYNNNATGIAMYMIDAAEGAKNNKVYNNTIINPTVTRWNILMNNGSTGNTLYNNILINHHNFRGSISIDESSISGFQSDYNILENRLSNDDGNSNISLANWQGLGYDLHSMIAEPEVQIFVDHLNSNFHLLENAQAVNSGTNKVLPLVFEDLDNISRPQGNDFDIGCYEFQFTTRVEIDNIEKDFILHQNYPNPFNPETVISYKLVVNSYVSLKVFDMLGREVAVPLDEYKEAGRYELDFDGSGLVSGVYMYRLQAVPVGRQAEEFVETKKMILLK